MTDSRRPAPFSALAIPPRWTVTITDTNGQTHTATSEQNGPFVPFEFASLAQPIKVKTMTFTYTFAAGTANNAGFTVYTNSMTIGRSSSWASCRTASPSAPAADGDPLKRDGRPAPGRPSRDR